MNLITREELMRKLERGDEFKLVMTLPAYAFRAKRIPTSHHFETVGEALTALDPSDDIVVYCSNVYCAASIYAYRLLEREGYGRVRRYAGGLDDWEEAGYLVETGPAEPKAGKTRSGRRRAPGRTRGLAPWPVYA